MTYKSICHRFSRILLLVGLGPFFSTIVFAVGSCDNYTPDLNGTSVLCSASGTTSVGVISTQNSTTVGNNVSVTVDSGVSLVINGSTIGIGSGARVTNNGNLNTSQFYYGYGISSGANGRSQSGGSTLINNGTIYTGGISAAGMYISATNAGSDANTLSNAGSITTSGANSAGMRLNSGATNSNIINTITNTGAISTSGSGAHGIQTAGVGAVSVLNAGSIITSGANSFGIYNTGNIVSLTNSQGGSTPLTYSGVLPLNYNVIVTSPTSYGKLDVGGWHS